MIKVFSQYLISNNTRIKKLFKESVWVLASQIIIVIGSLLLVRVLTEYLEPSEYGRLSLSLTIALLINQSIMSGITAGITRFYSISVEKQNLKEYLWVSRRLVLMATLVVILVAAILIVCLIAFHWHGLIPLVLVVLLFSILNSYNGILRGVQNAARQRVTVAIHGCMDAVLKISLVICFLSLWGGASIFVVIAYVVSISLVTLSQIFFFRRLIAQHVKIDSESTFDQSDKNDLMAKIWNFSWPFSFWGFFTWMQQASDRWALEAFTTTDEVGRYAVLFQLGYMPIGMISGLMVSFVGPIFYQRSGDAMDDTRNRSVHVIAWRITFVSMLVVCLGFVFTFIFHEWIFYWLVADSFRSISKYLPWVVLAGGFFAAGQILSLKLISELRPNSLLKVKAITALIGIVSNLIGAYFYGISGVICSLILFSLTYFLWMFSIAWKEPTNKMIG